MKGWVWVKLLVSWYCANVGVVSLLFMSVRRELKGKGSGRRCGCEAEVWMGEGERRKRKRRSEGGRVEETGSEKE